MHSHNNSQEALRLQSPESMTGHRRAVIAHAVDNLRPHARIDAEMIPVSPAKTSFQETAQYQVGQAVVYEAERSSREAADKLRHETSVDRIMQSVEAIYEGQGNPLYDQETL